LSAGCYNEGALIPLLERHADKLVSRERVNAMLKIFKRPIVTDLDRQLESFFEYKSIASVYKANGHKENLLIFRKFTNKTNILEVEEEEIEEFIQFLADRYTPFTIESITHSLRCFLRFYKRGIILPTDMKAGRPANLEMIQRVKQLREANVPYRDIQDLLELQEGKRFELKSIFRWAKYDTSRRYPDFVLSK
jgi:hypothetical protein